MVENPGACLIGQALFSLVWDFFAFRTLLVEDFLVHMGKL